MALLSFAAMSGYELARAADRSISRFWPISKPQVYAELQRLERLGLVEATNVVQGDTNGHSDIFLRAKADGSDPVLVSRTPGGVQKQNTSGFNSFASSAALALFFGLPSFVAASSNLLGSMSQMPVTRNLGFALKAAPWCMPRFPMPTMTTEYCFIFPLYPIPSLSRRHNPLPVRLIPETSAGKRTWPRSARHL